MSDLWQSRLNCTNTNCTVSTELNSWCLKNLRVELGIIKLKVKLHHCCICLCICLCSSESAKQLLQPLTLTRHPAKLAVCLRCTESHRLSLGEVTDVHLAHLVHPHSALETLGHSCPAPIPALGPLPLPEAMGVQDTLVFISGTSLWKYCYDDSHKPWNAQ